MENLCLDDRVEVRGYQMKKFVKDCMTSRDGESFSLSKILGAAALASMAYRFLQVQEGVPPDYQGFGIAVAAIITALAAKSFTDPRKPDEAA